MRRMTKEEAKVVLMEHEKFLNAAGEYRFTMQPTYTIEEVNQAKEILAGKALINN